MKPLDEDIRGALNWAQIEAEIQSDVNGSNSDVTQESRRVEVVLKRLAREAGYDLSEIEVGHE